jgi:hypothetical protein
MLGKANEIKTALVNGVYLETGINRKLKELGDVLVLDIKYSNDSALIIYTECKDEE